jgi:hypothetical protein
LEVDTDGLLAAGLVATGAVVAGIAVAGTVVAGVAVAGVAVPGLVVAGEVVAATVLAVASAGFVVASGDAVVKTVGAAVVPTAHDEVQGLHNGTLQSSSVEIESHQLGHNEIGIWVVVAGGKRVVACFGVVVGIGSPHSTSISMSTQLRCS